MARRSSRRPVVVLLIHGGGWIFGTPEDMEQWVPVIREELHAAAVSIDYPLGNVALSEQVASADARWYARAGFTVEALGYSAGGEIADWLAARCEVYASASISGPTNLVTWENVLKPDIGLATLAEQEATSPIFHIRPCASPMWLAGGNSDDLVPRVQQVEMRNRLHRADLVARYFPFRGCHIPPRWVYLRAIRWLGQELLSRTRGVPLERRRRRVRRAPGSLIPCTW